MSRAPTEAQRAAILAAVRAGLAPLRAEPPMPLSTWAAQHFCLSAESSHTQGRWEAYPFQPGWMDAFSNDAIEEVTIRKAKRVGYTKTLLAFVAYNAAHRRRKQALWQPTDDDRDSFVKSEVDPMLRDVKAVQPVLAGAKEDTLKLKRFLGSVLHTLGGKAARAYRRITVAVAMLDEADGFDRQIEKSADPITLARGRLEGAPFPKLIAGSTPRVKGLSHIETRGEHADAHMRFVLTCPHCQVEHPLLPGDLAALPGRAGGKVQHGFKWTGRDPATVRHVCPHCLGSITQADYLRIYAAGQWVSTCGRWRYDDQAKVWRDEQGAPTAPPRHVAFHIWTAYSPQRSWFDIVREFLEAMVAAERGDRGPIEGFVNETLGEVWEHAGDRTDEHELQKRAEPYPLRTVPIGALVLTSGVDVQGNRWHLNVWGWGRGLESWIVDRHVIEGNPADEREWEQVWAYLQRRYPQAWHGGTMGIDAVSIDSGFHTQAVYRFVREYQFRSPKLFAIKGMPESGKPIKCPASAVEVNWRGQRWPHGLKLWGIGTDSAKDLLHGQLAIGQVGPGYLHFSAEMPREFYEQLTAEQRIPVKQGGADAFRWVKRRPRNEDLDCRNYALHAAYMLGLDGYTDRAWLRLEAGVQPPPDLFRAAPPGASVVQAAGALAIEVAATEVPAEIIAARESARRVAALAGRDW